MKKLFLMLLALIVSCAPAFAESNYRSIYTVRSSTRDSVFQVGGTSTIYTKSFSIKNVKNDNDIGVLYKATSIGTVDLKIDIEQSYTPPSTEGSSDSNYILTHSVDTSVVDKNWNLATIDTVVLPYMRFVVTGQGSNDPATLFEIKVAK